MNTEVEFLVVDAYLRGPLFGWLVPSDAKVATRLGNELLLCVAPIGQLLQIFATVIEAIAVLMVALHAADDVAPELPCKHDAMHLLGRPPAIGPTNAPLSVERAVGTVGAPLERVQKFKVFVIDQRNFALRKLDLFQAVTTPLDGITKVSVPVR